MSALVKMFSRSWGKLDQPPRVRRTESTISHDSDLSADEVSSQVPQVSGHVTLKRTVTEEYKIYDSYDEDEISTDDAFSLSSSSWTRSLEEEEEEEQEQGQKEEKQEKEQGPCVARMSKDEDKVDESSSLCLPLDDDTNCHESEAATVSVASSQLPDCSPMIQTGSTTVQPLKHSSFFMSPLKPMEMFRSFYSSFSRVGGGVPTPFMKQAREGDHPIVDGRGSGTEGKGDQAREIAAALELQITEAFLPFFAKETHPEAITDIIRVTDNEEEAWSVILNLVGGSKRSNRDVESIFG